MGKFVSARTLLSPGLRTGRVFFFFLRYYCQNVAPVGLRFESSGSAADRQDWQGLGVSAK